jgi:hypothetical protein
MASIHTTSRATKLTFPDGSEVLVVTIEIDCPACGQTTLHFYGHHILTLQKILADHAAQYPDLVGQSTELAVLDRYRIQGAIPEDPSRN